MGKFNGFLIKISSIAGIISFVTFLYCMISSVLSVALVMFDTIFDIIPDEFILFLMYSFGLSFLTTILTCCVFLILDDTCIKRGII